MTPSLTPTEERAIISGLLTTPSRIEFHLDAWAALGELDNAIDPASWESPHLYHLYMALMYGRSAGIDWKALRQP